MSVAWWRVAGAPTAAEWSALFAGLTLAVAAVAAVVALVQYRSHLQSERARARPYVVVDYSFRSILMLVEIKNIGATPAADVVLKVDPPFRSTDAGQAARLNTVFSGTEAIAMLAPGRRILYSFDRAPDYYEAKLPDSYTVTLTYKELPNRDEWSWKWPLRREVMYRESYPLDFRQWSQATTEADYDNKNWNIANRGEKREKDIVSALQSIARSADNAAKQPTFEYVVDVVQEVPIVSDYAITHPDPGSGKELPEWSPQRQRRAGARRPLRSPRMRGSGLR